MSFRLSVSYRSLLTVFFLLATGAVAKAAEVKKEVKTEAEATLTIALFEYPPLAHLSYSGEISGTVIETIREVCLQGGLRCSFRILPVSRVYRSVFTGDADAIITGSHPSFHKCCQPTQWQIPWSAGIYSRKPAHLIPTTEPELINDRMIVIQGWESPYRYFTRLAALSADGQIKLSLAQDNKSAIRMLQYARADYMWGGSHFDWYFKKLGLENVFHYKPLLSVPLALWVDKNRPEIVRLLDEGYTKLKTQGLLNDDASLLHPKLMAQRYREAARY